MMKKLLTVAYFILVGIIVITAFYHFFVHRANNVFLLVLALVTVIVSTAFWRVRMREK